MSTTFRARRTCCISLPAPRPSAHARVTKLDLAAVRAAPGVVAVLTAADIPGKNDVSPVGAGDDPLFCEGEVVFHGQVLFAVAGESFAAARAAAKLAVVEYEDLPALLTIEAALAAGSFLIARSMSCAAAMPPRRSQRRPSACMGRLAYRRPGSLLSRGPGLARLADGGRRCPGPLLDPASLARSSMASPRCWAGRATPSPSRCAAWAAASAARRPRPRNGPPSPRWPRSRPDGPPSSASTATTT